MEIRKQRENEAKAAANDCSTDVDRPVRDINDEKIDFDILKTVVISDETIDFVKEKIILTQSYRTQILSDMKVDLRESFPYFFVQPELVSVLFLLCSIPSISVIRFDRFCSILK